MQPLKLLALLTIAALLAACSSGPPKRVFPPQASVQELRVQPDGRWSASIRIQNFSTVPMTFSRVTATLQVGGQDAGRIDFDPALRIGPGSTDIVQHVFQPGDAARTAVEAALRDRRNLRYSLAGRIATSDPKTDNPFEYQSGLDPVPGLTGVLR